MASFPHEKLKDIVGLRPLAISEIEVGVLLVYNGDHIPYVDAKFLNKGHEAPYLLPITDTTVRNLKGKLTWFEVPGDTEAIYKIIEIERRGKLPDIAWLSCSKFEAKFRIGLRYRDLAAKFSIAAADSERIIDDISKGIDIRVAQTVEKDTWSKEVSAEGW